MKNATEALFRRIELKMDVGMFAIFAAHGTPPTNGQLAGTKQG